MGLLSLGEHRLVADCATPLLLSPQRVEVDLVGRPAKVEDPLGMLSLPFLVALALATLAGSEMPVRVASIRWELGQILGRSALDADLLPPNLLPVLHEESPDQVCPGARARPFSALPWITADDWSSA